MSELDPNAVAVGVTTDLIKDFFKATYQASASKFNKLMEQMFPQFEEHLIETHNHVSRVKVICSPDEPVNFRSIFVSPHLSKGEEQLNDQEFIQALLEGDRFVVKSQGGSGKSFLLRHVWLELFRDPRGFIPIFLELRHLNEASDTLLDVYARRTAVKAGDMSEESFREFCQKGAFVFLLDGFDEVARDTREVLEAQILDLAREYPKCPIVVSGRPDDRFQSWSSFTSFSCLPFSYEKFRNLIEAVPYDKTSKRKFLKVATQNFFGEHEDFLSNPLLAIMMLMTYRENAEIPSKLSAFYENCYFTLYSRHDAMKEQFRREKLLDQNDFRRVFSLFCFFSYIKGKQDFTDSEVYHFIEKAARHAGCEFAIQDILHEFVETVNMIYRDGLKYWFVHRSFQEYFAAFAATKVLTTKVDKSLNIFASRRQDSSLKLAYELHQDLVLEKLVFPSYDDCKEELSKFEGMRKYRDYEALSLISFQLSTYIANKAVMGIRTFGPSGSIEKVMSISERVFDVPALMPFSEIIEWYNAVTELRIPTSSEIPRLDEAPYAVLTFANGEISVQIKQQDGNFLNPEECYDLSKEIVRVSTEIADKLEAHYRPILKKVATTLRNAEVSHAERLADLASEFDV